MTTATVTHTRIKFFPSCRRPSFILLPSTSNLTNPQATPIDASSSDNEEPSLKILDHKCTATTPCNSCLTLQQTQLRKRQRKGRWYLRSPYAPHAASPLPPLRGIHQPITQLDSTDEIIEPEPEVNKTPTFCTFCLLTFHSRSDFTTHLKRAPIVHLRCPNCDYSPLNAQEESKNQEWPSVRESDTVSASADDACCSPGFKARRDLNEHIKTCNGPVLCLFCLPPSPHPSSQLESHVLSEHHVCRICWVTGLQTGPLEARNDNVIRSSKEHSSKSQSWVGLFASKAAVQRHQKTWHADVWCHICATIISTEDGVLAHNVAHHIPCLICLVINKEDSKRSAWFANDAELLHHEDRCCHFCLQEFRGSERGGSGKQEHIRFRHGRRCEDCCFLCARNKYCKVHTQERPQHTVDSLLNVAISLWQLARPLYTLLKYLWNLDHHIPHLISLLPPLPLFPIPAFPSLPSKLNPFAAPPSPLTPLHTLLQISPTATPAQIKRAVRDRRIATHPDKLIKLGLTLMEQELLEEESRQVGWAGDILLDESGEEEGVRETFLRERGMVGRTEGGWVNWVFVVWGLCMMIIFQLVTGQNLLLEGLRLVVLS